MEACSTVISSNEISNVDTSTPDAHSSSDEIEVHNLSSHSQSLSEHEEEEEEWTWTPPSEEDMLQYMKEFSQPNLDSPPEPSSSSSILPETQEDVLPENCRGNVRGSQEQVKSSAPSQLESMMLLLLQDMNAKMMR